MHDGRVRVDLPGGPVQARSMADLLSRHAEVCRRYGIRGGDGLITVGDSTAGADWKGRLDLLSRTGSWDENLQWETYRGWLAPRLRDAREIERKVKELQERCRAAGESRAAVAAAVDVDAILKDVQALPRAELRRTQERVEAEMKKLEDRLKEAAELRTHAKGLRIFAEDVGRD
jgi:cell division protein ZapA (FtsZ GTPase activity inhibitor)